MIYAYYTYQFLLVINIVIFLCYLHMKTNFFSQKLMYYISIFLGISHIFPKI